MARWAVFDGLEDEVLILGDCKVVSLEVDSPACEEEINVYEASMGVVWTVMPGVFRVGSQRIRRS